MDGVKSLFLRHILTVERPFFPAARLSAGKKNSFFVYLFIVFGKFMRQNRVETDQ